MLLSADQVANWLRSNPNFFEDYAAILADIQIPHPHGGRAISISERQVLTLREKNKILESKLSELIQFGEQNDNIGEKIHTLGIDLIGSPTLDAALDAIYSVMKEQFSVPHTELRIWGLSPDREGRREFAGALPELQQFADAMTAPYCGQHAVYEVSYWFGEAAPHLRSFALIALRSPVTFGLLACASEDAQRFYPEMGTLYLRRLGELVSAGLSRFLTAP